MLLLWAGLYILLITLVILDLGVLHRYARHISLYEALAMSAFWISLGAGFALFVYFAYAGNWLDINANALSGQQALLEYLAAFSIEKTLSFDNLFVMAIIFHHFRVPVIYQHRVLMWGILGAIVLRSSFILAAVYILNNVAWMNYVFGVLLLLATLKFISRYMQKNATRDNLLVKLAKRILPVDETIHDGKLLRRVDGHMVATPLFITLLLIESADLMLATDSIPAIIAISREPFILISSNLFALLGLRALYFVLASALQQFHYLRLSMVTILLFIAIKMLLIHIYPIDTLISLSVILGILLVGVLASLLDKQRGPVLATSPLADELGRIYEITFTSLKRIIILFIGTSVIIVGIIMIFTPGPAIVVIPAGLAILATEFVWARRLLRKMEQKVVHYSKETIGFFRRRKNTKKSSE